MNLRKSSFLKETSDSPQELPRPASTHPSHAHRRKWRLRASSELLPHRDETTYGLPIDSVDEGAGQPSARCRRAAAATTYAAATYARGADNATAVAGEQDRSCRRPGLEPEAVPTACHAPKVWRTELQPQGEADACEPDARETRWSALKSSAGSLWRIRSRSSSGRASSDGEMQRLRAAIAA